MSSNNKVVKKYVLVAWQDSDIPDQIKDKSFGGKLAPSNKENQQGELLKLNENKLLKKKRISKRVSAIGGGDAPTGTNNAATSNGGIEKELKLDSLSISEQETNVSKLIQSNNKAMSHFVFGNQSAAANAQDGLMSIKTSNNKLDPSHRISYYEMSETLKMYKNELNDELIESLNKSYEIEHFSEWFRLMSFGVNILVYGVGSKKGLLQKFAEKYLANYYYCELLGYHHDFNTKNILKYIISDVMELTESYKTFDEQLTIINQKLDRPLYLLIHNIDGNCLRDSSTQYCLSELAMNKFIHIIASDDHINSPLLWDQMQSSAFKWVYFEVNTLVPYGDEIMFENSLMLSHNTNVQLSSMIHILKSLTPNAKNIFLILVTHVLDPNNTKKSVTLNQLYHECRQKFLVSNEMTLRAQLTEFIDHKIIKLKAESDGFETIYLLIDEKNLKLYLEDLKDKV